MLLTANHLRSLARRIIFWKNNLKDTIKRVDEKRDLMDIGFESLGSNCPLYLFKHCNLVYHEANRAVDDIMYRK